jgi:hypothetical protein
MDCRATAMKDIDRFVIAVHERIGYSKLQQREHTFRFRWEDGKFRFYANGIADQTCLDETLERSLDRLDLLDNVNRRWLLRGVRLGPGRFHPKSYLTINGRSVTLLVGSGNLSRRGIDTGREVFVTFRSGTPAGDAAIAIWRS